MTTDDERTPGDDPILVAYAMIRAYLDGDRDTVTVLLDGIEGQAVLRVLLNLSSSLVRDTAEQVGVTPGEWLDKLIRARLDVPDEADDTGDES